MTARHDYEFSDTEDVVVECKWEDVDGTPYTLTAAAMTVSGTDEDGTPATYDATVTHVGSGWRTYVIENGTLAPGVWAYDVLVTRNDGFDKRLMRGNIHIKAGITPNV